MKWLENFIIKRIIKRVLKKFRDNKGTIKENTLGLVELQAENLINFAEEKIEEKITDILEKM